MGLAEVSFPDSGQSRLRIAVESEGNVKIALMRDHKNVRLRDLTQVPTYRLRQRDTEEAFNALLDAKINATRAGKLLLKKNVYGRKKR